MNLTKKEKEQFEKEYNEYQIQTTLETYIKQQLPDDMKINQQTLDTMVHLVKEYTIELTKEVLRLECYARPTGQNDLETCNEITHTFTVEIALENQLRKKDYIGVKGIL